ncbi:MAG: hypothetical protein CFE44_15020 [Burkholderiales bacterium PBB4]|nr:MAG: hypothetical protein CFE44_15020 [Burkholderiales bacterium PBB4]
MLEFLLEVFGEFFFQLVLEALAEAGLHAASSENRTPPNPFLAALGYALLGAMAGAISVWIFPHNFVPAPWRMTNTLVTPVAAGWAMAALGAWRERRGQSRVRLDRFSYGYLFALSLAVVRLNFAA